MPKKEKEDKILDEIKRHNKVLMEHMEHQVRTVTEQYGSIKEEISQVRNSMDRRFDTVEMAVMENSQQMKGLKAGQEGIEKKLDTVLADHKQRITKLEQKVSA